MTLIIEEMTDSQLVTGILNNSERAWIYICRNMRGGFKATMLKKYIFLTADEIDDLFQESCITLMEKVKEGHFVAGKPNGLFNYLLKIGELNANNLVRKKKPVAPEEAIPETDTLHEAENRFLSLPEDVKKKLQKECLDRVIEALPDTCRRILKLFYWDHKPMDDIASIVGMKNADSVIAKKSKCIKKAEEIRKTILDTCGFSEEDIRDAFERSALRALLKDECTNMDEGYVTAAYEPEDDED